MNKLSILPAFLLLAGCVATQPPPTPPLTPADLPAQPDLEIPPDPLNSLPDRIREAYQTGVSNEVKDGITLYIPYRENDEPVIHTAPGHVTEIVFGDTERVTAATAGDSLRWSLLSERNRIRVKPCPAGCSATNLGAGAASVPMPTAFSTNLIVDTDVRTYHLSLVSGPLSHANESVAFWYPTEIAKAEDARKAAMHKAAAQAADPPTRLNFNYTITGPEVPWKPVQAFDDGSHEYILFQNLAALRDDMPALYVQRGSTQELVNYQPRGNYYVIDRLYTAAALTQGVGADRQTVLIEASK